MSTSVVIHSVSGKPLARIFEAQQGFGFEHLVAGETQQGFDTYEDAHEACMGFHDEWFENL